ncbi:FAD-dependent oxidoreductase [Streptomyces albidus (ex Kaewkla and Franco 2022)]|uniref:FAD-dependent oxidoreductase n=1 Tax=Streptomyces albidus (ex Kaewkla and Franco 2022) TaxID=722709 RepID=UPI002816790F|nr:FAD-dependent oxidoreductase [Streptomyces albidus (ex Kaewkla and Franco 2022)]
MSARPDAVVIGGGVIGLTTAIILQESGLTVQIWTGAPPESTTSAVAGATWFPYRAHPVDRVLAWSVRSKAYFDSMTDDPQTGVRIRESLQLWREELGTDPWWASAVPDLDRCAEEDLPDGYLGAYRFTQPVVTMPVHLPYLTRRFRDGGGTLVPRSVESLGEAAKAADVSVNCTGMAARDLSRDTGLIPVRGQWVRVTNPGITKVVADFGHPDGEAYIIPHEDSCILGGTADEGAWETTPSMDTAAAIIARCAELDPRLADARVLEHRAALRPVRPSGVRLELDDKHDSGGVLVHNYGHGGSGVTLSWGCAEEVKNLVLSRI